MDLASFVIGFIIGLVLGMYISATYAYSKCNRQLIEFFDRHGLIIKDKQ